MQILGNSVENIFLYIFKMLMTKVAFLDLFLIFSFPVKTLKSVSRQNQVSVEQNKAKIGSKMCPIETIYVIKILGF